MNLCPRVLTLLYYVNKYCIACPVYATLVAQFSVLNRRLDAWDSLIHAVATSENKCFHCFCKTLPPLCKLLWCRAFWFEV